MTASCSGEKEDLQVTRNIASSPFFDMQQNGVCVTSMNVGMFYFKDSCVLL